MSKKTWLLISVVVVLVALLAGSSAAMSWPGGAPDPGTSQKPDPTRAKWDIFPDFIMINGNVITVDSGFSIAQAVAVKDDKIIAVGSRSDVMQLKGPSTKTLDLKGATVLPGIHDSHIHLSGFGLERPPLTLDVGYPTVESMAGVAAMVQARVDAIPDGEWIRGWGWDRGFLQELVATPEDDWPTKAVLDPVSPTNPVALTDFSGHVSWVNSKALELAGITAATPDPANGTILRDPVTGEPTGILLEAAARMVTSIIPPWSEEQQRAGILNAMAEVNSLGITTCTEPGLGAPQIDMYNDLYNEGLLTVRMNLMVRGGSSLESCKEVLDYVGTHTGFGNEWLRISGFKLLADGIPPSKTAFMYPGGYLDGSTGQLLIDGATDAERYDELVSMIKYVNARGFQIGVHTTGDAGIDAVVDGFIAALEEHPWDARHYIIHTDYATPACAQRMAEWGILANVQSTIKWTIGNLMIGIVGEELAAYQWPLRTLIDAGVVLTNSSDASVTYPDWRQGVESAILREDKATGVVSGADQCISVEEAIRTYTINGAWQDHREDVEGSIEAGKLADFTIIGGNILTIDAHDISDIPVLMTVVGGQVVYDSGSGLEIK